MNTTEPWYVLSNIGQLDSPSLVVYTDRVKQNIRTLIDSIDDIARLRPHVKTHKSAEISKMLLEAGIKKFKCATIAEAEMLASVGAPDILLAYQPVGPKAKRLSDLTKKFPDVRWSCLVDNAYSATELSAVFEGSGQTINVYFDLNVGMNRTGIVPLAGLSLYNACKDLKGINVVGLHVYDGHLRDADYSVRKKKCDEAFEAVLSLRREIEKTSATKLAIVAGGSPTFSIHCKRKEIECSPGTFIYWDKGYETGLREQHFVPAALVVTRVISLPAENIVCTDLGHKAIASENPLANRVSFLNAPDLEPVSHSEEHMVFKAPAGSKYKVGDVLYGVPYHVCPTVALHEIAYAVSAHQVTENWTTEARKRKLTI